MEYALMAFFAVSVTTIINLLIIWWIDRFEKEPVWLLLLIFVWGAVPSVVAALIFSTILQIPIGVFAGPLAVDFFGAVLIAPVIEETAKACALFIVFLILRSEFDDVLDGMIYGAVVGIGFAFVEDILYITGAGDTVNMGVVFVLRVLIFAMNHAFFTALTGIGLGLARMSRNWFFGIILVLLGLFAAMTAHGTHNLLVSLPGDLLPFGLLLSTGVHWFGLAPAFILLIVIVWIVELRWIRRELEEEREAGHITQYEVDKASHFFGRFMLQMKYLFSFDIVGYFRVRKLSNLLVKLAFRKRHYRRYKRESMRRQVEHLRTRIASLRSKLALTG
jgi:RsiW-degrading membrane proteinase PrsW (M82 family)